MIINFILKFIFIKTNSIAGDEPFTIYHAQMDVPAILHHLKFYNNPPLYEIFLHFWMKFFGISELSVRFPSLIFSVFTVYFIYRICKEFFNYRIALIASLLFAFSTYHIFFSHEARVYPMFAMLTSMSMFYFLKICNKQDRFKNYHFLFLVNAFMIYSHYFSFFIIFLQAFSIICFNEIRKQQLKKYSLFILFLIIVYIPHLSIIISRFIDSAGNGTWLSKPEGIESIYNMLWKFSNMPVTTVFSIIILFVASVKFIVKKDFKNKSIISKIIFLWFLFPFFFMFFISYWIPMFLDRYLIFVSLAYYLVLAICSSYIIEIKKFNFIIPSALVLMFIFTTNPNGDNDRHVKETIAKIKELKNENTYVLVCPQSFVPNFVYYYDQKIFQDVDNQNEYKKLFDKLKNQNVYFINNINEVSLNEANSVIYLDAAANFLFPNNNIFSTLNAKYNLNHTYKFYEIFIVYEFQNKK